eukprot:CAMPEP_0204209174 /NCGR_PEP_ID=MMETSP0361-20130328/73015_1 /ASSEMBLY_ACC=CAM_ASM_000343 /TAXON_ID=268821 /ORGANISM="Scrippsiella Hangoei, Strain SHTV-5" /LENGTH=108 /DNA_ID=CAMNT_0051173081 /DNA_START=35 /DNA_END=358 /DNA_ORIENTATION=-
MAVVDRVSNAPDVRFRPQFRKTELCAFFERGWCRRAAWCEFAHGAFELRVSPSLKKTSVCKRWAKYKCKLSSEECPFAHGSEELRATWPYVKTPKHLKPQQEQQPQLQ